MNRTTTGYVYREPEVATIRIMNGDPVWTARITECLPVFPADNARDRSNQHWCSKCGWQPVSAFGRDKTRTDRQGRVVYQRLCRSCDAERKRSEYQHKPRWKR